MRAITYCVYREEEFFVAQCLNVDVSSFGSTREEAVASLQDAVELWFEGEDTSDFTSINEASVGQLAVNA